MELESLNGNLAAKVEPELQPEHLIPAAQCCTF